MIELALNNPTLKVGYLEYHRMHELNVDEVKEVSGGSINAPAPEYMYVQLPNGTIKKVQVSPHIFGG